MALSDHLREPAKSPPYKTCGVCWVRDDHATDEADVFAAILADRDTYPAEIVAALILQEYGVVVGRDAIYRHRRGGVRHEPV